MSAMRDSGLHCSPTTTRVKEPEWGCEVLLVCGRWSQALRVQAGHARAWQGWRGLAHTLGVRHPQTPASRNGLLFDWSFTAGLCAADRDTVEGFPWPGRPRGWAQLGAAPLACIWPLRFFLLEGDAM